ncbi:MAG: DUF2231 domain-containing protein [Ignavibacteriaceae bacterium]
MEFLAENHPRIVHFAVALLFIYPLLELIGVLFKRDFFSKAAYLLLSFGVLAALGAVLTGEQAHEVAMIWEEKGAIMPFKAINEHRDWANITLWYFAGVLVLRTFFVIRKKFIGYIRYIFVVLALIGVYFVFETGDHGGQLVYKHGVGTELKKLEFEE